MGNVAVANYKVATKKGLLSPNNKPRVTKQTFFYA